MRMSFTEHHAVLGKAARCKGLNWLGLGLVGVSALVAPVGSLFPLTACAAPTAPDRAITVRVYDYTQASPSVLARAEREAGRIFGEAGLTVAWLDCTPGPTTIPPDPCQQAIEAADVRLRILLTPVPSGLQESAFGFAIAPALATVYYDTALGFAKYDQRRFEAPIVLGCVIAHEIGHLLLGSNGHSISGIMRARWDRGDVQEALMGAMLFTPKQARLMQAETQRRARLTISRPTTGPDSLQ